MLEPTYAESVKRYNARQQDAHRWLWVRSSIRWLASILSSPPTTRTGRTGFVRILRIPPRAPAREETGAPVT